jgi:hypothetical protein
MTNHKSSHRPFRYKRRKTAGLPSPSDEGFLASLAGPSLVSLAHPKKKVSAIRKEEVSKASARPTQTSQLFDVPTPRPRPNALVQKPTDAARAVARASRNNRNQTQPTHDLELRDLLQASYDGKEGRRATEKLDEAGYILDIDLSNDNEKVFYNPQNKKLLYAVAGTHNMNDVKTDVVHLFGGLKQTQRYKEGKERLEMARTKYEPDEVVVTGHSLGGSIASYAAKKKDHLVTYNKFFTYGQKNRANEESIRHEFDIASLAGRNDLNTTSIRGDSIWSDFRHGGTLPFHGIDLLRGRNFTVSGHDQV